MATLRADSAFQGGWFDPKRPPVVGLRAFGRVYASWGLSQAFYWEEVPWFPPALAQSLPCPFPYTCPAPVPTPALPLFLPCFSPHHCSVPDSTPALAPPPYHCPALAAPPYHYPAPDPTTVLAPPYNCPAPDFTLALAPPPPQTTALPLILHLPLFFPPTTALPLQGPYAAADALFASCSSLMPSLLLCTLLRFSRLLLMSQSLHLQRSGLFYSNVAAAAACPKPLHLQ